MKYEFKLFFTQEGRELRKRVDTAVRELHAKYAAEIPLPRISYFDDPMMMAAARPENIGLNMRGLFHCTEHVLTEGIAHEFAHLLLYKRDPEVSKRNYHGPKWQQVMKELGYPEALAEYEGTCMTHAYTYEEVRRAVVEKNIMDLIERIRGNLDAN